MKIIIYFLIGGVVVSAVTYLAGQSRGLHAAFVANLPIITLITFLTVNYEFGREAVVAYAKGLVIMLVPWLAYIGAVIVLSRRLGVVPSLVTGLILYFLIAFMVIYLKRG